MKRLAIVMVFMMVAVLNGYTMERYQKDKGMAKEAASLSEQIDVEAVSEATPMAMEANSLDERMAEEAASFDKYVAEEASSAGHHGHMDMAQEAASIEKDLGICPVMGGAATKEYFHEYQGKTYYFCCPSCIEEFKKDPEKYISKVKIFNLEAYQFGFEPNEIRVKKGDIVKLLATSRDVAHGIYIKEYDVNERLEKDQVNKIEFAAKIKGEFDILCSVYCGQGHQAMKAKLIVE
jgi:cytochrome c oxidase subunit II